MLLAATTLARLPFGINGLAVLLFLREVTGSFAIAGLGTGALALGAGAGAPLVARLVDRRGVRLLLPLAIAHAAGLGTLVALGLAGAPNAALLAAAGLIGVSFPPSGSVLRARWPELLVEPALVRSAYALDTVLIEVSFITGPLLTAAIVALAGPEPALIVSAALVIAGTALFVARLPGVRAEPAGRHADHGILGALAVPAVRAIALTTLPVGFCLGAIEVALPAFGHARGTEELGGVLLALWSTASAVGGLVFGVRAAGRGLTATYLRIAFVFPLACLPLAAMSSPAGVAAAAVFAGLPIAPLIASRNELLAAAVPSAVATEAFTWLVTALVAGLAIGSAVAGAIVEAEGWPEAVLVGVGVAGVGAALALAGRRRLVPDPAPA